MTDRKGSHFLTFLGVAMVVAAFVIGPSNLELAGLLLFCGASLLLAGGDDMTNPTVDLDGLAGSLRADGHAWEDSLSDMGPFETLDLTHAQVESYAKTFFEAADEIDAQRKRADRAEAALRRVGGGEALGPIPFTPNYETQEGKELLARIEFARQALNGDDDE